MSAEDECALRRGFESRIGTGSGEAQDAKTRAVALFGMAPRLQHSGDEHGRARSYFSRPLGKARGRELLGEAPVGGGLMV